MANNFNDPFATNLIGLWDFLGGSPKADTGLADGVAQNGSTHGGAYISGDKLKLDGDCDHFDVDGNKGANDAPFDLAEGTIAVQFSQDKHIGSSHDTLVNRGEYADKHSEGWFAIQVTRDEEVKVLHHANGKSVLLHTSKHFFDQGDEVKATYAWSETEGLTFKVENLTTGKTETITSGQTGLTMDIGDNDDEIFTFGARESDDGRYDQYFDGKIDYVAVYNTDTVNGAPAGPVPDGVVDGENFGETMVLGYDDSNAPTDQGGDQITTGDDVIFGNGGDDIIDGNAGNDVIYGDDGGAGATTREVFEWSKAPGFANGADATGGFSQDTGSATVTFSVVDQSSGVETDFSTDTQNTDDLDATVSATSSLDSVLNSDPNTAHYQWASDAPLENVEFRINDIDGDGRVTVRAYDVNGNPIAVTLSDAGSGLSLSNSDSVAGNDTATSTDNNYTEDTAGEHSVLVTIAGPVARWEVIHNQDGSNNSGINITDIAYDVTYDAGLAGDDTISGGAGDDTIFGEAGDDTLAGDAGTNYLDGGVGDDTFIGGEGADTFNGGTGQDNLDYSASAAGVSVDLSTSTLSGGDADNDTIAGGIDGVIGSEFDDTLVGFDQQGTDPADTFTNELFGEGGNDTLEGRGGADVLSGGDDRDTIIGGTDGDVVDGGAGGDDYDVLDLRGVGDFDVVGETTDADGNSTSGTINFLDAGGNVTGSMAFTEIEEILGREAAPVAVDDVVNVDEDSSVTFDPTANDSDPDGDPVTVGSFTQPANGTVTQNPDGTLTYTPDANYNGTDTFDVTVTDPSGLTATSTVTVNVAPINDAPDAVNDTATTDEETAVTIDVLGNDSDVDGDALTITAATVPADQGSVAIVNNELVFTPATDFFGEATISYSIEDGNGGTDVAEVTVTVNNINDAPVAVDDIVETPEDTPVTIDVLGNDVDVDGDPLTIASASVPADQGSVAIVGNEVVFTPAPNFNGPATITYTVDDGQGGTDTGTATVNVGAVNDGPTANDDAVTTDEDTPITIDVLGNDTDADGDALEITAASVPAAQGSVAIVGNELVFTPAENFNGDVTISYSVSDGNGGTDSAEVAVTVTPVNDAPVAVDDIQTTDEDMAVVVDLLGNDTDVDGDTLTLASVSVDPAVGSVSDNGDGTVTFTPAPNYNGPATISYTVSDGQGGTDTGEAVVSVGAVNDSPLAVDDTATTLEDTPITVDVLANDSDPDGDPLTVISASVPASQGTVAVVGNQVEFNPAPDFNGTATITYTVSDGNGLTDTGSLEVTVTPDGDAPVTVDDAATTDEDTSVTIDPLGNDSDPDGDPLSFAETPVADNGTVNVNPDGTIEYTPNPDFNGTDTITYMATDPDGNETPGTITVTVNPVNDAPVAVDDSATTPFDTAVVVPVLANDTDVDGDALRVTAAISPDGTVVINPDNTLTFTPTPGFEGTATIDYSITDDNGGTDSAQVTVTVQDQPLNFIVEGDDTGNLIDENYLDDPQGDRVDANDNQTGTNDDVIIAGGGDDTVYAGEGDDDVDGGTGDDTIFGEEGDDTLDGGEGDDTIHGGTGDDTIIDLEGSNEIYGGDGSDTVTTGDGDDFIDTVSPVSSDPLPDLGYPGLFDPDADPNNDKDVVNAGNGNNTVYTGDDDDVITTGDGDDYIDAGFDQDIIVSGGGDDIIIGGEGDDTIEAGDGNDTVYGGLDPVFPDALNIPDDGSGPFGPDAVVNNGQDVIDGGAGDDRLFGQDDDDTIIGGTGDDYIDGGVDDDVLSGGAGDDTIIGGQGMDTMSGGDDQDTFLVSGPTDGYGDVIDGGSGGVDFDTLDLRGAGPLAVTYTTPDQETGFVEFLDNDGNVVDTLDFTEIESVIPCFTPGTRIATPKGERLVETLEVGDRIITRDNGIQEIRWIGQTTVSGDKLHRDRHLRPVLIRQGALGNDLPERDMLVSPNHRVLVANDKTALYFEESEVLVAAKHLTGLDGVDIVDVAEVTYVHFMFDQHEVVLSDGAWTESFQPGDMSLAGVGNAQRTEILELFPELKTREGLASYTAARRSLKKHEATLLM